jgi:GNAT superfamily N-acetyltransferase
MPSPGPNSATKKDTMEYVVRSASRNDLTLLIDTDIKCFDTVWSKGVWKEVLEACRVFVALHEGKVIGFAAYQDNWLLKLGVKREHRRQGVSRRLLAAGLGVTKGRGVYTVVPESSLMPGDPYDLSLWLKKLGFSLQRPFLRDHFTLYGQTEDGVPFVHGNPETATPSASRSRYGGDDREDDLVPV